MSLFTHKKTSERNPSFFFHLKSCSLPSRISHLEAEQHRFPHHFDFMDINLFHLKWSHNLIFMPVAHHCPIFHQR